MLILTNLTKTKIEFGLKLDKPVAKIRLCIDWDSLEEENQHNINEAWLWKGDLLDWFIWPKAGEPYNGCMQAREIEELELPGSRNWSLRTRGTNGAAPVQDWRPEKSLKSHEPESHYGRWEKEVKSDVLRHSQQQSKHLLLLPPFSQLCSIQAPNLLYCTAHIRVSLPLTMLSHQGTIPRNTLIDTPTRLFLILDTS